MAVVQAVCGLEMQSAAGGVRAWEVTARAAGGAFGDPGGDYPAGAAVTLDFAQSTAGTAPPDAPNQDIEVTVYVDDTSTVVRTYTFPGATTSSSVTLDLTNNGTSGGGARIGTLRLRVRVEKTNGGPTATYHADSDGTNATAVALGTITRTDQGWLRSNTDATVAVSNVSDGGGKVEPAEYAETVWHAVTLDADGYSTFQLSHTFVGTSKSKSSSGTAGGRTATFSGTSIAAGRVNEGFPAADGTYAATVTATTTSGLHGGLLFTIDTVTTDTLQVDPRLTAVPLLTLNVGTFPTPPRSAHETSGERPSSDFGRIAFGIRRARGTFTQPNMTGGHDGLTVDIVGQPDSDPSVTVSATSTTDTRGGEAGWTDYVQWTSPLPGGDWTWTADITAPADINDDTYLVNGEATFVLIASQNPFVAIVVDAGHGDSSGNDRHMHNGDLFEVAVFLEQTKLGDEQLIEFDDGTVPQVAIKRIRDNMVQYWDGTEFQVANPDLPFLPMTQQSTYVWTYTTPTDDTWSDVIVQVAGLYNGVAYSGQATREFVGNAYHHDLDTSENVGVVITPIDPATGARLQSHLHAGMDCQILVVPRTDAGVDPDAGDTTTTTVSIRRSGDDGAADWDGTVWWPVDDPDHPAAGDFLFITPTTLPSGVAVHTLDATQVTDTITTGSPWLIVSGRVVYDAGDVTERTVLESAVVPVHPAINRHDRYAFDGPGFVGFPTR